MKPCKSLRHVDLVAMGNCSARECLVLSLTPLNAGVNSLHVKKGFLQKNTNWTNFNWPNFLGLALLTQLLLIGGCVTVSIPVSVLRRGKAHLVLQGCLVNLRLHHRHPPGADWPWQPPTVDIQQSLGGWRLEEEMGEWISVGVQNRYCWGNGQKTEIRDEVRTVEGRWGVTEITWN